MLRRATTILLTIAVTSSIAAAQPSPDARGRPRELSPALALGLSLGVTAAGYASLGLADNEDDGLVLASVAVITLGPSAGHWYQGRIFTRGLAARAIGLVAVTYGVSEQKLLCNHDCGNGLADTAVALGLAAFLLGSVADLISAPLDAAETNRKNLTVTPQVSGDQAGIVLAGSF